MADTQNTNVQEQDIHQLLKVKREKLANLQQAGKDPFQITKYDVTHHSTDIKNNFEELEGKTVRIAGRVMSKRVMGKASFCNVQDLPGNIQVYVARDSIGEESYADFKKYDVGDIVGIEGEVFKTKTGEISVHASQVTLLSKSLQILPEKFHGLTNTDIRYRQRYTDLIMNQDVKDTFVKRSRIISAIRRYLDGQGFLEVETPMLVSNAGGAAARPFETHYNALDEDVKLRISLELYLKRLIVGGMERVFEIGRVFRNEGLDTRHNPEFTLMELYQAYTDYYGMMDLTENMFRYVAQEVCGTTVIPYAEETIDLGKPFERLTMVDAVKKYAGVDFDQIPDTAAAKKLADEKGVHYEERHAKGDILNLFFEEFVEEHLIQPVFIMDHPVEISPLTKRKPDKPDYVERFELFIYGREMCNAYSELNDPIDQRERFKAQEAASLKLPLEGTVLISVNKKDKPEVVDVAKRFHEDGFKIIATGKTCDLLNESGIPAEKVKKLYEGRPNILDMITNGKIDLVVNSPAGKESVHDDSYLRKAAIKAKIPYMTTIAAAKATAEGIGYVKAHMEENNVVKSLQQMHSEIQ